MTINSFLLACSLFLLSGFSQAVGQTKLWYAKPAVNWNEALPIGNGRIGAMLYGGVRRELISLNEQTLWSGGPHNWNNPEAKKFLPLVREAVLREDYRAADSLSRFMQGPYTESYLPMADMVFEYDNIRDSSSYRRELDLDHALSRVQFTTNGHKIVRTTLTSFPDRVLVYHDSSSTPGTISYKLSLTSKLKYTVKAVQPGRIVLRGKCPKHVEPAYLWKIKDAQAIQYAQRDSEEGMTFEVQLIVSVDGGRIDVDGEGLRITNASSTTVVLAAATSFNGFDKSPGLQGLDPSKEVNARMNEVSMRTYSQLLGNHIHDYQPIFNRMKIDFNAKGNDDLPTDERLKRMKDATDLDLLATIMQYTRYLLISGSRPGGQPVNLKGIWNDRVRPEYSSNWCLDHDAQMFYYPVETNNLSEMHEPFLGLIKSLSINGEKTAQINYGMKGWCAHHNTDIWASTAPVGNYGEGNPHWANWNMSGPWLSAHMFDHYRFTGDKKFLADEAWPVMKGAALFCLDWLIRDDGVYQTMPSVSPENTFITEKNDTAQVSRSTTADISMIKELFLNCIETTEVLKIEKHFARQLREAVSHLPNYPIGSGGQLLEWQHEWRSVDPVIAIFLICILYFPVGKYRQSIPLR
jgi:alpha-L-fucosidase 2